MRREEPGSLGSADRQLCESIYFLQRNGGETDVKQVFYSELMTNNV